MNEEQSVDVVYLEMQMHQSHFHIILKLYDGVIFLIKCQNDQIFTDTLSSPFSHDFKLYVTICLMVEI